MLRETSEKTVLLDKSKKIYLEQAQKPTPIENLLIQSFEMKMKKYPENVQPYSEECKRPRIPG